MPTLLIFTAIRQEAAAIRRALRGNRITSSLDIQVRAIGIGAVLLPADVAPEVRWILLAGFAGGLDPSLKVGDLVLDAPAQFAAAASVPSAVRGRIVATGHPVVSPQAKGRLFEQSGAAAVDMEGDAVRALAAKASIPLIHLRAISDARDDAIDPEVLRLVGALGQPRPAAIVRYLMRHPNRIQALLRLGGAAKLAGGRLGEGVNALLPAFLP